MTFQEEMKRKLLKREAKEEVNGVKKITKESEVAEIILKRLKNAIKKYSFLSKRNDLYVSLQKEDCSILVQLEVSFVPDYNNYEEAFYVQTNFSKNKSDIYYLTKIVGELEFLLKKDGFTKIIPYEFEGMLYASLDLD